MIGSGFSQRLFLLWIGALVLGVGPAVLANDVYAERGFQGVSAVAASWDDPSTPNAGVYGVGMDGGGLLGVGQDVDPNTGLGDRLKLDVDCDAGESVATAVRVARRGAKITISGICQEQIVIRKDGITLDGQGTAGFDGATLFGAREFNALITVDGARDVTLKGLYTRNGPAEGIVIEDLAEVVVRDVTSTDNVNVGMIVDHARVRLDGGDFSRNQGGVDTTNNASILLSGDITFAQNGQFGIAASNGAAIDVRGATINASDNTLAGVLVEGGHLAVFNFNESVGSQILANNNGLAGLVIAAQGSVEFIAPPLFFFSGVNLVQTNNNQDFGIILTTGSSLESGFGAATFEIQGNPVGLSVTSGSNVTITGGLEITNNSGPGLLADGAGTVTIAPLTGIDPLGSEIVNNNPDVVLEFGSRAAFDATVGTIECNDGTAIARGSISCP